MNTCAHSFCLFIAINHLYIQHFEFHELCCGRDVVHFQSHFGRFEWWWYFSSSCINDSIKITLCLFLVAFFFLSFWLEAILKFNLYRFPKTTIAWLIWIGKIYLNRKLNINILVRMSNRRIMINMNRWLSDWMQ